MTTVSTIDRVRPETQAQIRALREAGVGVEAIARRVGIGYRNVQRFLASLAREGEAQVDSATARAFAEPASRGGDRDPFDGVLQNLVKEWGRFRLDEIVARTGRTDIEVLGLLRRCRVAVIRRAGVLWVVGRAERNQRFIKTADRDLPARWRPAPRRAA